MPNEYRNNREVHFMVWETNPMRNKKKQYRETGI